MYQSFQKHQYFPIVNVNTNSIYSAKTTVTSISHYYDILPVTMSYPFHITHSHENHYSYENIDCLEILTFTFNILDLDSHLLLRP